MDEQRVATVRDAYRSQVVEWAESADDPERANRLFRENHQFYKDIRHLEEGRAAISSLLSDPLDAVCLMAATHSLEWDEADAIAVLTEVQTHGNPYGVDAEYTLRTYLDGRLDLDW